MRITSHRCLIQSFNKSLILFICWRRRNKCAMIHSMVAASMPTDWYCNLSGWTCCYSTFLSYSLFECFECSLAFQLLRSSKFALFLRQMNWCCHLVFHFACSWFVAFSKFQRKNAIIQNCSSSFNGRLCEHSERRRNKTKIWWENATCLRVSKAHARIHMQMKVIFLVTRFRKFNFVDEFSFRCFHLRFDVPFNGSYSWSPFHGLMTSEIQILA